MLCGLNVWLRGPDLEFRGLQSHAFAFFSKIRYKGREEDFLRFNKFSIYGAIQNQQMQNK